MLAQEVIDRVRSQFSDPTAIQITDAEIINYINDALKDLAYKANLNQTIAVADVVVGQRDYALPDDILTMINVRHNGIVLQPVSYQEADNFIQNHDNPTVQAALADPTHYWIFARVISLWPTPVTALLGGLKAYYTRVPIPITNVAQTLDVPMQYHNTLLEKVLQWAHEKDENWQAAQIKEAQYTAEIKNMTEDSSWDEHEAYPNITTATRDSDTSENLYTGAYWY